MTSAIVNPGPLAAARASKRNHCSAANFQLEDNTARLHLQAAHLARRFQLRPHLAAVIASLIWEARP